jgi:ferric-dicitrate binding protein FerR (iron transport regulator)/tetratricopeptide (TPR) repeat protein
MNENDPVPPGVSDQNIGRLLETAYKPEVPDATFVQNVEQQLCAAAAQLAQARSATVPPSEGQGRLVGRRLAWVLGLAASLAGLAVGLHLLNQQRLDRREASGQAESVPQWNVKVRPDGSPDGLRPRPRPAADAVKPVAVGETLQTKAGERRRVSLPDGSVLYLNQNTELKVDETRRLTLSRGEVYIEVTPREKKDPSAAFVVHTNQREVSALGTKFAVQAEPVGTGVVVTQGKVKVSGLAEVMEAGQQLPPGADSLCPAPRFSHLLEWTRDLVAAAESPLVPCSKHAGGALLAIDPYGQESQLSLRKYHIDVHIEDGFARTTIDQTYFNHTHWRLEGTFYFPLPPDASLSRLAMYVEDGKDLVLNEGGMAERDYARSVYETIRYTQRDPALLEWVDGSTFKMRVFPLEGRKEKRIILSYTQRLSSLYGYTRYRFPGGLNMGLVDHWSFHARVKNGDGLRITSPSHPKITPVKKGTDVVLDLSAKNIKPDKDVMLEMHDKDYASKVEEAPRLSSFTQDGFQYLMVRYRPKLVSETKQQRRDWVFLFESSANRDPLLARAQIDVIRTLLLNAEHEDTFTLLTVNNRVEAFAKEPKKATPQNIEAAVKFLEATHLIGALDLGQALDVVVPILKACKNPYLVHVGAGTPAVGERRDDILVKRLPDKTHYVGIGVGKSWNRALMKSAAERTGGLFTQINPDEPLAWRAFELLATLNTPRLMNVRVVDNGEKMPFLSDAYSLAQGEEICAMGRIDATAKLPKSLSITATLDGKAYVKVFEVKKVAAGAGYLPRTWAKLEIDRLLAAGGEKHKNTIIELSKAMYVMSPYTSLLVLETEEDYKRFKVDRGRKDHWALYRECESRIPNGVVYEPVPGDVWNVPVNVNTSKKKLNREQVMQTILVRTPPRFLYSPQRGNPHLSPVVTAWHVYVGAFAVPYTETELLYLGDRLLSEDESLPLSELMSGNEVALRLWTEREGKEGGEGRLVRRLRFPVSFRERGEAAAREWEEPMLVLLRDGKPRERLENLEELMIEQREVLLRRGFLDDDGFLLDGGKLLPSGKKGWKQREWDEGRKSGGRIWKGEMPPGDVLPEGLLPRFKLAISLLKDTAKDSDRKETKKSLEEGEVSELLYRLNRGGHAYSLLYDRPAFTADNRVFGDLLAYAPGMNTSMADIQAILEAEATPSKNAGPGSIDPVAADLIKKARTLGWQTLTLPGSGKQPGLKILVNGAGQFVYERTVSGGLREQVICDGTTLLHLYPELGVGARRNLSRFHRAELSNLVPWALPPVEDLAHGVDVKCIAKSIVALVPHGSGKKKDGKVIPHAEIHLVFGEDGRLVERRVVEMPAKTILLHETYDAGVVKLHDTVKGKVLGEVKLALAKAAAPNLKPDTSDLVVLRLPYRTWEHVRQTHNIAAWAEYAKFNSEVGLELMAACLQQRSWDALAIFAESFHAKGDRRIGFYTLLASAGLHVQKQYNGKMTLDVAAEHPNSALAKYLAHHNKLLQTGGYAEIGDLDGLNVETIRELSFDERALAEVKRREASGQFIPRLAEFRDLWHRWYSGKARESGNSDKGKAERSLILDYLQDCSSPAFAWVLLDTIQRYGYIDAEFQKDLAKVYLKSSGVAGLAYAARYEHARSLYLAGNNAEAQKRFRELYEQTLKEGILPPIDSNFRAAFKVNPEDQEPFTDLMRKTASWLAGQKRPHAILLLAWQMWQLGDQPLADELFGSVFAGASEKDRQGLTLAGIEYLSQTGQYARADALLQTLLKDEKLAERASLWQLASVLAGRRGQLARSVTCLEKALDIEYRHLPAVINLQAIRNDYSSLLSHYQQMAVALTLLEKEPPRDFVAKVIRAADRWRSLDSDSTAPCHAAARILQNLGAREIAWDYLLTPIGMKPNEAAPWQNLAQMLRSEGDFDLADRAYQNAFEAEPTNAQILWDRAQNLQQTGKVEQARELYRQLADGNWQPRFQWLKSQAQSFMSNR